MAKCVITGCGLDIGGQYFWGDLHEQGDQWIFNAVVDRTGEAATVERGFILPRPSLHTSTAAPSFERRGLFIIPKATSELNQIAQEYLSK